MDVSVVADAFTFTANAESLGFAKFLLLRRSASFISLSDPSCAGPSPRSSASPLHVSALLNPVDVVAPPPVKSDPYRILLRRSRRAKRRQQSSGGPGEGDDGALYGDAPFGGGFGFNGGGGGGGGRGWNFDGFGSQSWDDSSRRPRCVSGFAFDFIYEVIYWIALSKCIHFAFNRVARIVADTMIEDVQAQRKKAPVRLTAMC
ncbi:uncharacterized protein LOC115757456 [Rhodamnia argentea]|uniref:Uncharacterized protein LOC115757456 n=1 Tax=Rhodamnia argentea TaxID=178133 RepID=A0ABM3HL67_9MYRT|nr:uncharacterized protein LOC115757456 [Rhodamnia argentea]